MCRSVMRGGRRFSGHSTEQQRELWRVAKASQRARKHAAECEGEDGPLFATVVGTGQLSGLVVPDVRAGGYADIKGENRTRAILDDLTVAVEQIAASGQVERWLEAMSTDGLRRWSMRNRLVAMLQLQRLADDQQRPELLDEVHMMSFKQWKETHGRTVRKGEKAIWILAPMTRKVEEEQPDGSVRWKPIVTGFRAVPAFNVTQTEGPDLPRAPIRAGSGSVAPGVLRGLQDRVQTAGYIYREERLAACLPDKGEGTLGYTDPKSKVIVVDSRLSEHQKASTIAHELGHVHVGHVDRDYSEYQQHRGQMETEAEAAAYVTCRRLGMDKDSSAAFSPGYIAGWMGQKGADFAVALDRAVKASDTILDGDWPDHD